MPTTKTGTLNIVSIPIGNKDDITLRALKVLKSVDVVIAEESKGVQKLFRDYDFKKDFFLLNEHNENRDIDHVISFLENGENLALVSDAGTPVFADPGQKLVSGCLAKNIIVKPIPGASSLMSALAVSSFDIKKFHFAGFLGKNSPERVQDMKYIQKKIGITTVIMETPYRIIPFFEDLTTVFSDRKITFVYKATMDEELIIKDFPQKILKIIKKEEFKGEFVVVVPGNKR